MIKKYIKLLFLLVFLNFCATLLNSQSVSVYFTTKPKSVLKVLEQVRISWKSNIRSNDVEFRYKLNVSGDWMGGYKYAKDKWSNWGATSSVYYSDFVKVGRYSFDVEARLRGQTKITKAKLKWKMYLEMPSARSEAVRIDWYKVRRAANQKERYKILANEYRQAYQMYYKEYVYHHRILKLTSSPDKVIKKLSLAIVGGAQSKLLEWAEQGVSNFASKILAPKAIYDIMKEGSVTLILLYRNYEANRTASMTVASYYAWKFYERIGR